MSQFKHDGFPRSQVVVVTGTRESLLVGAFGEVSNPGPVACSPGAHFNQLKDHHQGWIRVETSYTGGWLNHPVMKMRKSTNQPLTLIHLGKKASCDLDLIVTCLNPFCDLNPFSYTSNHQPACDFRSKQSSRFGFLGPSRDTPKHHASVSLRLHLLPPSLHLRPHPVVPEESRGDH